jgi:hypothetical protein
MEEFLGRGVGPIAVEYPLRARGKGERERVPHGSKEEYVRSVGGPVARENTRIPPDKE